MSLLKDKKGKVEISYQLPLKFDDQLRIFDDIRNCVDMQTGNMMNSKVWELIKDNVIIEVSGKEVWLKGKEVTENSDGKMLGYSYTACEIFVEKFMVFIKGQGIQLEM